MPILPCTLTQLEHHVQQAIACHAAFRPYRAMPDRGERRFDRIGLLAGSALHDAILGDWVRRCVCGPYFSATRWPLMAVSRRARRTFW